MPATLHVRDVSVSLGPVDMPAIEQPESALESFEGTVLLVSHDRKMLERFAANVRVHVSGGQVRVG